MKRWFRNNPLGSSAVLGCLVMLVLLAWGVSSYGSTFLQDFMSNWLATLFGVIIGVPLALLVAGYQERVSESQHKNKILILLKEELLYNQQLICDWNANGNKLEGIETIDLKDEIWNAFSDGGELQWIKDPNTLGQLANAYSMIKALRNWVDNAYAFLNYTETYTESANVAKNRLLQKTTQQSLHTASYIESTIAYIDTVIS